jgi:RHS repeat-associated protein
MDRSGHPYYYHQNALWSVEAITNSIAVPVERYAYDAYGSVIVGDGAGNPVPPNAWGTPHSAIGNPWLFTGRQIDEETGRYFYRARYYDPTEGRFTSRDPMGYAGGMHPYKYKRNTAELNLYAYVEDRPTYFADPLGWYTASVHAGSRFSDQGNGGKEWFVIDFTVDDDCCKEFNVIQTERHKYWYWRNWSSWMVDDGSFGRSDKAASPPYYNDVNTIRDPKKPTHVPVWDSPSTLGIRFEFEDCLICMEGAHRGLVYGCFKWHTDGDSYVPGDAGGGLQPPSAGWVTAGWTVTGEVHSAVGGGEGLPPFIPGGASIMNLHTASGPINYFDYYGR